MCEYYEQFGDKRAIDYLNKTFEGIYLPTLGKYSTYPIKRNISGNGGVDGHSIGDLNGWRLSTDIGCAFMSIDGLSHYYAVTSGTEAKEIIDEMAEVFDNTDKYSLQAQTHCTLTAARGFMRMYDITNEKEYLEKAKRIFDLYTQKGMTYTYQNFNWFGKGDTWTEACAIVDSLMLATELYRATENDIYRMYAARIYFNGFATLQRPNGGAGTDTTVSDTTAVSEVKSYEAKLCCSMRLSEGLWYISTHRDDIFAEVSGKITKDEHGIYRDTDILYCEIPEHAEKYAEESVSVDGRRLFATIKLYKLKDEAECCSVPQKITFKD